MNSTEVRFKLEVLTSKLSKYAEIEEEINALKREIKDIKNSCDHNEAYILEEGTEFDGYDRNDYFCDVKCPDCGKKWTLYDVWDVKREQYKIIEGVTKLQVWRR